MQIENLIKNKKILMIPVYSTRSYDNGVYDILSDGNTSKFLMKIFKSNAKEIDIFYPKNSKNVNYIEDLTNKYAKCRVTWLARDYGKNAHETRNMGQRFYDYIMESGKQYDFIISEIDMLAFLIAKEDNYLCNKFIYWAGSYNADGTPWYEEGHNNINQFIASKITTACLLEGQVNLYKGKSFFDECVYRPQYFDKKIIFFPFRLSDNCYHAKEFCSIINDLKKEYDNFIVLYTDVNDSHLFDKEDNNIFIKVPSNKFVYQAILKGRPIIPYLDDITKNYHSNIFEFTYYKCDVIMLKNDNDMFQSVTQIKTINDLSNILKEKIRR